MAPSNQAAVGIKPMLEIAAGPSTAQKWGAYRRRAWTLRIALIAWIPIEVGLGKIGLRWFARFVFPLIFSAIVLPAYFWLVFFRCPRCRNSFFAPGGVRNAGVLLAVLFFNRCQTCSLHVGESPEQKADESP